MSAPDAESTQPPSPPGRPGRPRRAAPSFKRFLLGVAGVAVVIQLIPYGWSHENPPTKRTPQWDSPRTEALVERACADCHSNETKWPWYSYVAPVSWVVRKHVDDGRALLNFSEWDRPQEDAAFAPEMVRDGMMPLQGYVRFHAEAELSEAEQRELIEGLRRTLEADPPGD